MKNKTEKPPIRFDNLLEGMGLGGSKILSDEEQVMKRLLVEEYKKRGGNAAVEVKKWRENHPDASLGDAIRSLYQELEQG